MRANIANSLSQTETVLQGAQQYLGNYHGYNPSLTLDNPGIKPEKRAEINALLIYQEIFYLPQANADIYKY